VQRDEPAAADADRQPAAARGGRTRDWSTRDWSTGPRRTAIVIAVVIAAAVASVIAVAGH
jgi:hypothetical protein